MKWSKKQKIKGWVCFALAFATAAVSIIIRSWTYVWLPVLFLLVTAYFWWTSDQFEKKGE